MQRSLGLKIFVSLSAILAMYGCDSSKPKKTSSPAASASPLPTPCPATQPANTGATTANAYPTSTPAPTNANGTYTLYTLVDPTPMPSQTAPAAGTTPAANTAATNPCGNVQGQTSNVGDMSGPTVDVAAALNDPKKAECDGKKVMFNRQASDCYTYTLDQSWCTSADTVAAKFQEAAGLGEALKQKLSSTYSGYTIDQCGMDGTKPAVTVYKVDQAGGKILTGLIKPN